VAKGDEDDPGEIEERRDKRGFRMKLGMIGWAYGGDMVRA